MNNKVIYDWILDSGIEFDQMINEFDFLIYILKKTIGCKFWKLIRTMMGTLLIN